MLSVYWYLCVSRQITSRIVTEIQRLVAQKSQILPTLFSFSALVQSDPLRIYGKALRFLKLESSRQPMVKIW